MNSMSSSLDGSNLVDGHEQASALRIELRDHAREREPPRDFLVMGLDPHAKGAELEQ